MRLKPVSVLGPPVFLGQQRSKTRWSGKDVGCFGYLLEVSDRSNPATSRDFLAVVTSLCYSVRKFELLFDAGCQNWLATGVKSGVYIQTTC